MRATSRDTSLEIERVQIDLLRAASVAQRFERARSLSRTVIRLARRALRRRHPDLSELELAVLFVELNYGEELARNLRQDLQRRGMLG